MNHARFIAVAAALIAVSPGCSAPGTISEGAVQADTTQVFARIDSLIAAYIRDRAFPGAALAIGHRGTVHKLDGYGTYTYESTRPIMPESVFDLASLTKVIATTTACMLLYEEGLLDLDTAASAYLPALRGTDKAGITVRQLLTHTSGFMPFRFFYEDSVLTRAAVLDSIFTIPLQRMPGEDYAYSDFGMITLLLVIESITGQDFATYAAENIFEPLGMASTGYRGTGTPDASVVPTELDDYFRHRLVQGEVHDETAWILGGTAGHAGLFSSATDVARFASMMAQGGRYDRGLFLSPETVEFFTTVVDSSMSTRALGWDTKSRDKPSSSGEHFGPRSFGHTGFTGTSIWIDPDSGVFVVFLTNRVYPTRENYGIIDLRPQLADLTYEALVGTPVQ